MNILLKKATSIYFLSLFLTGCATIDFHGPDRFARSVEVYDGYHSEKLPSGGPADSKLQVIYSVPFEDAFRAAKVSATQIQLFVEAESKDKGVIFAVQSKKVGSHINNYIEPTLSSGGWIESAKHFYLISVNELASESSEVTILNKVQLECKAGGAVIATNIDACVDKTKVHWPYGKERDISTMEMFHNFLRNNLISAGLL